MDKIDTPFNAIIVGTGAIGSALATAILLRDDSSRIVMMGRRSAGVPGDPRVTFVKFDASDPESIVKAASEVEQSLNRAHLLLNTVGLLHSSAQQPEKNLRAVHSENLLTAFQINAVLLPLLAVRPDVNVWTRATVAMLTAFISHLFFLQYVMANI